MNTKKFIKHIGTDIDIKNEYNNIHLITQNIINKYSQKYTYLHIGLIQMAVKLLHRLGIDSPNLICLRDKRNNFNKSIISILELNLHSDPTYCNYFPNFTINIKYLTTINSLVLDICQHNKNWIEGTSTINIIYRIAFKVSKTNENFKALRESSKEETIIFEAKLQLSQVTTPKKLQHSQISFPEE